MTYRNLASSSFFTVPSICTRSSSIQIFLSLSTSVFYSFQYINYINIRIFPTFFFECVQLVIHCQLQLRVLSAVIQKYGCFHVYFSIQKQNVYLFCILRLTQLVLLVDLCKFFRVFYNKNFILKQGKYIYFFFSDSGNMIFILFFILLLLLLLLLLSRFSHVRLCVTPQTTAHQAPPSLGFSKQEQWSGLPFPSLMRESEK